MKSKHSELSIPKIVVSVPSCLIWLPTLVSATSTEKCSICWSTHLFLIQHARCVEFSFAFKSHQIRCDGRSTPQNIKLPGGQKGLPPPQFVMLCRQIKLFLMCERINSSIKTGQTFVSSVPVSFSGSILPHFFIQRIFCPFDNLVILLLFGFVTKQNLLTQKEAVLATADTHNKAKHIPPQSPAADHAPCRHDMPISSLPVPPWVRLLRSPVFSCFSSSRESQYFLNFCWQLVFNVFKCEAWRFLLGGLFYIFLKMCRECRVAFMQLKSGFSFFASSGHFSWEMFRPHVQILHLLLFAGNPLQSDHPLRNNQLNQPQLCQLCYFHIFWKPTTNPSETPTTTPNAEPSTLFILYWFVQGLNEKYVCIARTTLLFWSRCKIVNRPTLNSCDSMLNEMSAAIPSFWFLVQQHTR